MFFNLALRNSRRSRKENGLFFASLLISVVAFLYAFYSWFSSSIPPRRLHFRYSLIK